MQHTGTVVLYCNYLYLDLDSAYNNSLASESFEVVESLGTFLYSGPLNKSDAQREIILFSEQMSKGD